MQVTLVSSDQYFGGGRLAVLDQLGSAGTYFPWGEDKGSTDPQNTWSYATYWRDSGTNLDYANNRYYNNAYGRFMTPDPATMSASPTNPQSWNRYAYVLGDPVNALDPLGLCGVVIGGITESSGSNSGEDQFASQIKAMEAFPYAGTSVTNGIPNVVNTQFNATIEAYTVVAAIEAAAADSPGSINIFAVSGGAAALTYALTLLPSSVSSRIGAITYLSPGMFGTPGTVNGIVPTVVLGQGVADSLLTGGLVLPSYWNILRTACAHDGTLAGCEFAALGKVNSDPCNSPGTFSAQHLQTLDEILNWGAIIGYAAAYNGTTDFSYSDFEPINMLGLTFNPTSYVTSTIKYNGP